MSWLSDALYFIHRCSPAVVYNRLAQRGKRAQLGLVERICRIPLGRALFSRTFLTSWTYLPDVEQNQVRGFSNRISEETPHAQVFPATQFPDVYRKTRSLVAGDLFGLHGYPAASAQAISHGGLIDLQQPQPALVYVPPARFHCTLSDGYLQIESGGVCTPDGIRVLDYEPLHDKKTSLRSMWQFGGRKPHHVHYQPGLCVSLAGKWSSSNYFHWLIDGLSGLGRIAEAAKGRPVTVLVSDQLPSEWLSALEISLPTGFTLRKCQGWVQMEQFLYLSPDRLNVFAWLTREEQCSLREPLFRHFGLDPEAAGSRRIYISRSQAMTRRLVNEAEIETVMNRFGFETVRLEGMSLEQQVRLFHSAAFVAGVHGAGITNIVFANPGRVLEFFPAGVFKPLYFGLSASLAHDYHFLQGGRASPLTDFRLDPELLRKLLLDPRIDLQLQHR